MEALFIYYLFLALLVSGLTIIIRSLSHIFNRLNVYNKRITCMIGVFSRREVSILIRNVDSVEYYKTFLGRILNYGTIVICSSRRTFRFSMISNVEEIMTLIVNAQDLLEAELMQAQTNAIINAVGGKVPQNVSVEKPVVSKPVVPPVTPVNPVIPQVEPIAPVVNKETPETEELGQNKEQKQCKHCGETLEDDTPFCPVCGKKVEDAE